MKYRKRPIVIEAAQWFKPGDHPMVVQVESLDGHRLHAAVRTLEGWMMVTEGDWIICGVNGEYYPCKPDIFEKTYEAVAS